MTMDRSSLLILLASMIRIAQISKYLAKLLAGSLECQSYLYFPRSKFLPCNSYKEKIPLTAILYLHRISDDRVAGSTYTNLQVFANMCGQSAMPRVCLVTTMWSETHTDKATRREQELKETFWKDMIAAGCNVKRFENSYQSAWQIVGKMPPDQETIILSHEVYDDKKMLNETAAGVKLAEELNKLIKDEQKATRRLAEEVQKPINNVGVQELRKRQDEVKEKIGRVATQLQVLRIPSRRKLRNFFVGPKARNPGLQ